MGYENENWLTPDMVLQFIIALYYFGIPAMVSGSVFSATDIVHTTVGVVRLPASLLPGTYQYKN